MLPVVEKEGRLTAIQIVTFTVMLLPISLAPFFIGVAGYVYLVGAIDSRNLVFVFEHSNGAGENSRTIEKTTARFGFVSSRHFRSDGF